MKKYLCISLIFILFPLLGLAQEQWNFVKKQGSSLSTDIYYASGITKSGDKVSFKRLIVQIPYSQEELDKRFGVSKGLQYWTRFGQQISEKQLVDVHKTPIDYQMHYIEGVINCSQKNYIPVKYKQLNQQYKVIKENTFPTTQKNKIYSTDSIEGWIYDKYCTLSEKKNAEQFVIQERKAKKNK